MPLHLGCFLLFTTLTSYIVPLNAVLPFLLFGFSYLLLFTRQDKEKKPFKDPLSLTSVLTAAPQAIHHHRDLSPTEGNETGVPGPSLPEDLNSSFSSFVQTLNI